MTHAPSYWAEKLPPEQRPTFWGFIREFGVSGETAFYWTEHAQTLQAGFAEMTDLD